MSTRLHRKNVYLTRHLGIQIYTSDTYGFIKFAKRGILENTIIRDVSKKNTHTHTVIPPRVIYDVLCSSIIV